jgi:hypothetical protein
MLIAERKTRYTLREHFLRPGRKISTEFQEARKSICTLYSEQSKSSQRITPLRAIKFIFGPDRRHLHHLPPVGAEISFASHLAREVSQKEIVTFSHNVFIFWKNTKVNSSDRSFICI